ncbi:MAG: type I 3-dehydroquinate dehydratase [Prevotellaceae bacterium]|jgi:3-dehydroquinate dehydratase type I|nr:type I 3-dehydroquinate dehydratase [Prevotellaceae bacterium]
MNNSSPLRYYALRLALGILRFLLYLLRLTPHVSYHAPYQSLLALYTSPICVSLAGYKYKDCLEAMKQGDMAEIRLDTMNLTVEQTKNLFRSATVPLIATFRPGDASDTLREEHLRTAIHAGAAYVDIELDAPYLNSLMQEARTHDCKVILSYHNSTHTPGAKALKRIVQQMQAHRPDVLKIVTHGLRSYDRLQLWSLYGIASNLVAFCTGANSGESRIASGLAGAPFMYAAPNDGPPTADGQFTVAQLRNVKRDA